MEILKNIFGTWHYLTLKILAFKIVNGADIENRVSTSTFFITNIFSIGSFCFFSHIILISNWETFSWNSQLFQNSDIPVFPWCPIGLNHTESETIVWN